MANSLTEELFEMLSIESCRAMTRTFYFNFGHQICKQKSMVMSNLESSGFTIKVSDFFYTCANTLP